MVLTLYKMDASPPVRAVYMVIEALKLSDVQYIETNLLDPSQPHMSESFLKLNPQHTIPLLTDDNFAVWDSHAIIMYLVNKYGKGNPLYPLDPEQRAIVDLRLHFDSGILYPALRETDEPIFFFGEKSFRPEGLAKIKAAYDFTEKFLDKPWLAGDAPTLADISCVASISSMNEMLQIDEELYPRITAWLARCAELDYYKKGNQPGLEEYGRFIKELTAHR